ncbi:unnamed protein product [Ectocarpus sp. 4 AP-2014]
MMVSTPTVKFVSTPKPSSSFSSSNVPCTMPTRESWRSEDRKKVRAHSLGSAKFLFHHALEHRKSGPIILENTCDDTKDSGMTRSGCERAVWKGSFSPFKLADDGTAREQHYDELDDDEMVVGSIIPTSTSSPRVCTNMTRAVRAAADNDNRRTAPRDPVHREPLRRSTWLGPDLMPLQNYQDAARINSQRPDIIKFTAAAWPTPKQNGRRGGANRGVHGYRGADRGGSNGSSSNESDVAREVRRQRMRGSFQRNAACSICGTGTNSGLFSNAQHRCVRKGQREVGTGGKLPCSPPHCRSQRRHSSACDKNASTMFGGEDRLDTLCDVSASPTGERWPLTQSDKETYRGPSFTGCSGLLDNNDADERENIATNARSAHDGVTEPQLYPHHIEQKVGTKPKTLVVHPKQTGGFGYSESDKLYTGAVDALPKADDEFASFIVHEKASTAAEEAGVGVEEVDAGMERRSERRSSSRGQSEVSRGRRAEKIDNAQNEPIASEETTGRTPGIRSLPISTEAPRPAGGGAGNEPRSSTATKLGRTRARPTCSCRSGSGTGKDAKIDQQSKDDGGVGGREVDGAAESTSFQFPTPELVGSDLAVREPLSVRRQTQLLPKSQPHRQQPDPFPRHQWLQQRRGASDDQDDQSECTVSEEKHLILLTRRLKQLVQLESLTIQWEGLSRRERENLDRKQWQISSRLGVAERVRRDSSFSLSASPSCTGPGSGADAPPSGGRLGGSISDCSTTGGHQLTAKHVTSKTVSNSSGGILPSSDASIFSSIDRPRPCAGVAGTKIEDAAAAETDRGSGEVVWDGGVRVEAGSIELSAGKSISSYLESRAGQKAMPNGVTPRGERRPGGIGGSRWKRGGGSGRITWNVRDADIASGLARRGRLGDWYLGIVGTRSLITSEDR